MKKKNYFFFHNIIYVFALIIFILGFKENSQFSILNFLFFI